VRGQNEIGTHWHSYLPEADDGGISGHASVPCTRVAERCCDACVRARPVQSELLGAWAVICSQ
jgi:hypothetical protein